jgi:hypothetical protein
VSHGHVSLPKESDLRLPAHNGWNRLPIIGLVLGVLGMVGALWLKQGAPTKVFYASYLTAYMFWLSIALGGMFFVVVQYAARAGWSIVVRRLAENAMITLPLMGLLALPFLIWGNHDLYHWTHHHAVEADPILKGKEAYLNLPFWWGRAALYFALWCGLALYFYRNSTRQDETGDPQLTRKLQRIAPPAILIYGLSQTFAVFDWVMSLDPHWFSTMFGVYYFAGSALAIFAFMTVISYGLRASGALKEVITVEHYHDLAKYLFGFVVFWAYISFSQYMLYWYANIPEETMWFSHRWTGNWKTVSVVLAVGHFVIPFYFLMARAIKRAPALLLIAAIWLLAFHYIDLYWQIMPSVKPRGRRVQLARPVDLCRHRRPLHGRLWLAAAPTSAGPSQGPAARRVDQPRECLARHHRENRRDNETTAPSQGAARRRAGRHDVRSADGAHAGRARYPARGLADLRQHGRRGDQRAVLGQAGQGAPAGHRPR